MEKREKEIKKGEIIIYRTQKGPQLEVKLEKETVWLSLNQISLLFEKDKSVISRHIRNIYKEKELSKSSTVANFATVQKEGGRLIERKIEYYNVDLVISVGYRTKSKRATQFRIWATEILKKHLINGYTINEKRLLIHLIKLRELQNAISFLEKKSKHTLLEGWSQEIINLLSTYSKSLSLLEKYDSKKLTAIKGGKAGFKITYKLAKEIIFQVKEDLLLKKEAGSFFGEENGYKFDSIINNIYQTFEEKELYYSIEEKAANLLYLVIKDHPFVDGNKRIASFLFIYFLSRNNYLQKEDGEKKINDNALVALSLLIAVSDPKEKEIMIKIITNLIKD
jgi:death-on-curing family protein